MFVFLIAVVLLALGIRIARSQKTYGSSLEQYIADHNPQNNGDVERLTVEYHLKASRGEV